MTQTPIAPRARVRPAAPPPAASAAPGTAGIVSRTAQRPVGTPATPVASARAAASWMKTGAAAREATDQELLRQREAADRRANGLYMPFRFRMKVGEQREIIILDHDIGPCFYEHQLLNPRSNKWDIHETCPKEWEPCPICDGVAGGKESYYVMMLTCIDLTPWTDKKGVEHPHSKFLLPVKAQQQGFFRRQLERQATANPAVAPTLRGLHLLMTRDTAQSVSIGNPEFLETHSEEDILASFGHEAVVGNDGKVIKQKNADCQPYPYDKLFKKPSAEDLRKRYGGMAPAGSRQEEVSEWDQSSDVPAGDSPFDTDQVPM